MVVGRALWNEHPAMRSPRPPTSPPLELLSRKSLCLFSVNAYEESFSEVSFRREGKAALQVLRKEGGLQAASPRFLLRRLSAVNIAVSSQHAEVVFNSRVVLYLDRV